MEGSLDVNGVRIPYRTVAGEVLDVRLLSETHVWGSGGGGTSDTFGNIAIDPVRINSRVRNRAHAVVRWEDGLEGTFEADTDFALRTGHGLVAVHLTREGQTARAYVYNRNTGQFWTEELMRQRRKPGIVAIPIILGVFGSLVTLVQGASATYSRDPTNPMVVVIGMILWPVVGFFFARRNSRKQKRWNAETKAINTAFKELIPKL